MNDSATARKWIEFVASRPEFSAGEALLGQFENGRITRICSCGCNSFDFSIEVNAVVPQLASEGGKAGAAFSMEVETMQPNGVLEFVLFTDVAGNLAGLDVHFNANSEPVSESVRLAAKPFHAYGELATNA